MGNKYKRNKGAQKITVSGNIPRPNQSSPATIIVNQPQRFNIDIGTMIAAIRNFENVDYSRRYKLYDLYADILMDAHLTSVINKRKSAILSTPIEFLRDGKVDEDIEKQLRSPWFYSFLGDALDSLFWGFSLVQFYRENNWVNYDLIPRKHVDPIRNLLLRHQTDTVGTSLDDFADLLFIGKDDSIGLLAQAAPYVIYKRNALADWAQFSEVFGMPVREYTYDGADDEARNKLVEDAMLQGSNAVYIHTNESALRLIESGNKSGSAELYDALTERCNAELSKLVLGNTLTTEAGKKGTQALGTVHKKVEDAIAEMDRKYILNILNFDMSDIFANMGINVEGGEFAFKIENVVDPDKQAEIVVKMKELGLPISDDYMYETFGITKPENYDTLKKEEELKKQEPPRLPEPIIPPAEPPIPIVKEKKPNKQEKSPINVVRTFVNFMKSFFVQAPTGAEDEEW